MTNEERLKETPSAKPFWRSKKFIAFAGSELLLFFMFLFVVVLYPSSVWASTVLTAIVTVFGFIAAGFILGVAALDKYTQLGLMKGKDDV